MNDKKENSKTDSESESSKASSPYEHVKSLIGPKHSRPVKRRVSSKNYVRDLDLTKYRPPRAGVILYNTTPYGNLYSLALDKKFNEWTDFGGGVKKDDETVVSAALRELYEETLGLVQIDNNDISLGNCLAVYNDTDFIIFIPISVPTGTLAKAFNEIYSRYQDTSENSCIVSLTEPDFRAAIRAKESKMYRKVARLLRGAGDFTSLLK